MTESLQRLFELVDRIVVVTIPAAIDRHADVEALMKRLGLRFDFHMGRDCRGSTLDELHSAGEYDPAARLGLGRPPLTPAEIGCALSHRDAARDIASGRDTRVLILEDDVRIIEGNVRHFAQAINTVPARWNLAYFGYAQMNLSTPFSVRLKLMTYYPLLKMLGSERHDPDTIRRIYRRALNAEWMHAGWFNNAVAYAVDRSAAAYISSAQASVAFEADLILNHLVRYSGLDAICLKYPIFDQRLDIASLIGARPSWKDSQQ